MKHLQFPTKHKTDIFIRCLFVCVFLCTALSNVSCSGRISKDETFDHYTRGIEFSLKGQDNEALKEYLAVEEVNPNYWPAHAHVASIYEKQSKLDAALAEYKYALALNPSFTSYEDNAYLYYDIGRIFFKQHHYIECKREYHASLSYIAHTKNVERLKIKARMQKDLTYISSIKEPLTSTE